MFPHTYTIILDSREVLRSYTLDQLMGWTYNSSTFRLEVEKPTVGSFEKEITLQTIQGVEICHLIDLYLFELSKSAEYAKAMTDFKAGKNILSEN